ncbi:MAG: thioredoxin domain-containing protein [Syntrophothermus sp.]
MPVLKNANRLIREKSPYLLQHAHNPVDWYPWGDEAFAEAKRRQVPIFLSIGYSTCHWCHVMERESFEDAEVAALLNKHFVAVKVDREERPDVDQVYMEVCQALTGQGGWPLTILMTPEKKPFFAGTYFPKQGRGGLPGLVELLPQVAELWKKDRKHFLEAGEEIAQVLRSRTAPRATEANTAAGEKRLGPEILEAAYQDLAGHFDSVYGGFGSAPKFPIPHQIIFLLRYFHRTGEKKAKEMAEKTLEAMRRGGIWDHVGFGFARYSTDRRWLVPHFEKMLYDNALQALAYLEAYQATGRQDWARVADDIFTYVLRDMTGPEGGFCSAEDADSDGVEGKFYLWTPQEVESVLGERLGQLYNHCYDISTRGNFEGKNIPNLIRQGIPELAAEQEMPVKDLEAALEEARIRLFQAREKRVHPHKDDKILTAWNGLMIAALARGAAVLQNPGYAAEAERAAGFIQEKLRRPDGRLLARYRAGEAAYPAYLDDYAFLAWGLLELYEATFKPAYLSEAIRLVQEMQDLFWDEENGGFFFYGRDAEELLLRPKELYDGALPSGNSVAAYVLQRLVHLTGEEAFTEAAQRQLWAFSGEAARYPAGHTFLLLALEWVLGPVSEIVIAGRRGQKETEEMLRLVQTSYLPQAAILFHPSKDKSGSDKEADEEGKERREIEAIAPFVREQTARGGRATAYVCRDYACQAPVFDARSLAARLESNP